MNKVVIEKEVLAAFNSLVNAAESLDQASYFAHFDPEKFSGVHADGSLWPTLSDLEALISAGFGATQSVESLDFSQVKVQVIDAKTAILINQYQQQITLQNQQSMKAQGSGLQVWSKSSGRWLIVAVASVAR